MSEVKSTTRDDRKINARLGCILLIILSSLGFLTDFLMNGQKLNYQLIRIEALAQGISDVGLHLFSKPVWIDTMGNSFGLFYGDTFLYIPALLRLCGVSVQLSFQIFGVLINVVTVLLAYLVFSRLFDNVYTGLLGAALYSMSVYRMFLMYAETELGEILALVFVPVVIYAVAVLFYEKDADRFDRAFLYLALGLSGIRRSHMVTFVLAVLTLIVILLINFRTWKSGRLWMQLGLAIVSFLLINASFFYDMKLYLGVHADVNPTAGMDIQTYGLQVAQLFMCFYQAGTSRDFGGSGVNNAMPVGLGFVMLVMVLLFLYLALVYGKELDAKKRRAAWQMTVLGLICAWLATLLFPWDSLRRSGEGLGHLISALQAPWHFLSMALAIFTVLGCLVYELIKERFPEYYRIAGVGAFLLGVLSGAYALANMLFVYDFSRIYTNEEIFYDGIAERMIDAAPVGTTWYLAEVISLAALAAAIVLLVKKKKKA